MGDIIRTGDFIDRLQRQNRTVSVVENDPGSDSSMMRGRFRDIELRRGLSVHVSDVVSLCDLTAETEIGPHISIKFFFQGKIDAEIGNRRLPSPQQVPSSSRWIPAACMLANRDKERFRNHTTAGNHIRKLKIRIEREWLTAGDMFADRTAGAIECFSRGPLELLSWEPTPALLKLANRIMSPPDEEACLAHLFLEAQTLSVIHECFRLLADGRSEAATAALRASEERKLAEAEDYILDCTGRLPSADEIATHLSVSVNTLHRLVRLGRGTGTASFVRTAKLRQARRAIESEGMQIARAAHLAGYSSPANFSTAFRREFGIPPKVVRG
ncbi:MAG TPA: AraC family transcriptional regulator [Rhizobium sp.]|nr:AraC family transcriptional regulator [Rhizobium sp.]